MQTDKDDPELLALLSSLPECWDYRCVTAQLCLCRTQSNSSVCVSDEHFANSATPQPFGSYFKYRN